MASPNLLRVLDRVEDRIRQHRQVNKAPLVIVEGAADYLVLRDHLPANPIFPADGKPNVLRAARALESWAIEDFVAIIDLDFDDPAELDDISLFLHPYDGRDLESMLISLGVLALVLDHQGLADRLADCGGSAALVVKIEDTIAPVTALRFHNTRQGLGLDFDSVDLAGKVDHRTLAFRDVPFYMALASASHSALGARDVQELSVETIGDVLGPRGKDVISVAGVALRKVAGELPVAAVSARVLTAQVHSSSGWALAGSEWLRILREKLDA